MACRASVLLPCPPSPSPHPHPSYHGPPAALTRAQRASRKPHYGTAEQQQQQDRAQRAARWELVVKGGTFWVRFSCVCVWHECVMSVSVFVPFVFMESAAPCPDTPLPRVEPAAAASINAVLVVEVNVTCFLQRVVHSRTLSLSLTRLPRARWEGWRRGTALFTGCEFHIPCAHPCLSPSVSASVLSWLLF